MFTLEFSTENAAFEDSLEVVVILERIAQKVKGGDTFGAVKDSNGNTVGRWSLSEEEP